MNTSCPLITVIIPVYNVEQYLEQCLESILNQTVIAHRAILVNDGSTDGSADIIDRYVAAYPEMFSAIHQENKGLGAARNAGIEKADSKYLIFLDSDDWLISTTIENVVKLLEKATVEPDVIFMMPVVYNMSNKSFEKWADTDLLERIFQDTSEVSPGECPAMYGLEASVCRNVWSTDLIKSDHFKFPEGLKWEDVPAHFILFHKAKHCMKVEDAGFVYRINSGKQITSSNGKNRLDIINVFSKTFIYAIENGWTDVEGAYIVHMLQSFALWSVSVAQADVREQLARELHKLYKAIPDRYFEAYRTSLQASNQDVSLYHLFRMPLAYKVIGDRFETMRAKKLVNRANRFLTIRKK